MAVGGFRQLERSYFDLRWHLDPVAATLAGLTIYDGQFGRYGREFLAPHLAALKSLATALEEVGVPDLQTEIDRTALLNDLRVTLHQFEGDRLQAKNPEFWLTHLFSGLHGLLRRSDRGSPANAAAMLGRLEDIPKLLDDARAALTDPVRIFAEATLPKSPCVIALVKESAASYGNDAMGY